MISLDDIHAMMETEEQENFWDPQAARRKGSDQKFSTPQPDVPHDMTWISDEIQRINPKTAQGEQSSAVQLEMKAHAVKNGDWSSTELSYKDHIDDHAKARGWKQDDFTWSEIIEEDLFYGK